MQRSTRNLPPVGEQQAMDEQRPRSRTRWRDIIIQALALLEDEDGVPYEQSALHKRRMKARNNGQ